MKALKKVALPLLLIGVILTLYLIWRILDFPPESELMAIAEDYYNRYGLLTVFFSAIVEGLILVGMYYPGSLVIFPFVLHHWYRLECVLGGCSFTSLAKPRSA